MAKHAIKYYNGQSAAAHQGTLQMKEDGWYITYEKEIKPLPAPSVDDTKPEQAIELTELQELTELETTEEVVIETPIPPKQIETIEIIWELTQIHKRETSSKTNTFYYGEHPFQCVECDEATFVENIEKLYPTLNLVNKHYNRLFKMGGKGVAMIGATIITLLVVIYFFVLPPVAENAMLLMPARYEAELGDRIYSTLTSEASKHEELTELANRFASHINFYTPYNIRITVVESSIVNAYAVPGGRIVVYTGLLDKMKNYEEFAALLGHEVAHVHQRHSLKAIARALAGSLFMSVIFSDINGMTAVVTENAQYIQTMHHSRSAESEADDKAAEVMLKNKINLTGLVDLFKRLEEEKEHTSLSSVLSYTSSHPSTIDRKKIAQKRLASQKNTEKENNTNLASIWELIKKN